MTTQVSWYEAYKSAVLETDWSKIEGKIQVAENDIRTRLDEFSMDHGGTREENRAIGMALNRLDALRKDVAAWQITGILRRGNDSARTVVERPII